MMRRVLPANQITAQPEAVCPVASNPVGDLVHAGFELL
jgi:hypothetical protein